MKTWKQRILPLMLAFALLLVTPLAGLASEPGETPQDIIILYTNDSHNAYEKDGSSLGYASIVSYKKQLEDAGKQVILVDAGDAIQGEIIGTLSKGKYIVDIMKYVGYSIAVPGNHEFDFGMDNFLSLADEAGWYTSCNFVKLETGAPVFRPYVMKEYKGGVKVAFIGICTPETFTKSTPTYFQDENGNYIYGFCEGSEGQQLYDQVQKYIDEARAAGADYVIALGHLGTDESSEPWTSKNVIANTTGLDAFIDGHSHTTIEGELCKNKSGEDVLLTSTGTKLAALGQMTISADGKISSTLVRKIDEQDEATLAYIGGEIEKKVEDVKNEVVATTEVDLVVNDPASGKRMVRSRETNLGDLCADAYREQLGADIAFVNGGGIRAEIRNGDITYGDIISVHPFGNMACLIEATGQQILDALEHGSRAAGTGESGGFLQVSGLTYEINTQIPSSVVVDDHGMFIRVDGEYRVRNVMVGGEPLDLNKTYKLASHNYMLKSAGDGYSMFAGDTILRDEVMIDNQVLINYIMEMPEGKITADSIYADPYGEGRIKVILEETPATCTEAGYRMIARGTSESVREDIPALGHSWSEWKVAKEPTVNETGLRQKVCSGCGDTMSEEIPKLTGGTTVTVNPGNGSNVQQSAGTPTGDSALPAAYTAAILAAAAVILYGRKRKETDGTF